MKTFFEYKAESRQWEKLLAEMARIGDMSPKYEVYIRSHEGGNIPHFHVWDKTIQGDEFHTCIQIKEAKYFHHTGKEDRLSSSMKKSLMEFLQSKPKKLRHYSTNWEALVNMWNNGDSEMEVDEDQLMPDYMEL